MIHTKTVPADNSARTETFLRTPALRSDVSFLHILLGRAAVLTREELAVGLLDEAAVIERRQREPLLIDGLALLVSVVIHAAALLVVVELELGIDRRRRRRRRRRRGRRIRVRRRRRLLLEDTAGEGIRIDAPRVVFKQRDRIVFICPDLAAVIDVRLNGDRPGCAGLGARRDANLPPFGELPLTKLPEQLLAAHALRRILPGARRQLQHIVDDALAPGLHESLKRNLRPGALRRRKLAGRIRRGLRADQRELLLLCDVEIGGDARAHRAVIKQRRRGRSRRDRKEVILILADRRPAAGMAERRNQRKDDQQTIHRRQNRTSRKEERADQPHKGDGKRRTENKQPPEGLEEDRQLTQHRERDKEHHQKNLIPLPLGSSRPRLLIKRLGRAGRRRRIPRPV